MSHAIILAVELTLLGILLYGVFQCSVFLGALLVVMLVCVQIKFHADAKTIGDLCEALREARRGT